MRFSLSVATAMVPIMLLPACGSGSGGSAPAAPNAPPAFTSAAAVSMVENNTVVQTLAATDADGDGVTFTISGGADASRFTITAGNELRFVEAANFDAIADANQDNIYEVTVTASDGRNSTSRTVAVTVKNAREGIATRRIATGFNQPIQVAPVPDNPNEVLVAEKGGRIYRLNVSTGERSLYVSVADQISTDGERGLIGIATTNRYFNSSVLLVLMTAANGDIVVGGTTLHPAGSSLLVLGPAPLMPNTPHAEFNNHNGGWIEVGPDGQIYVGLGDGGGAGDPLNNGQNSNSRLGKIIRFGLNAPLYQGPIPLSPFAPSPQNPYANGGGDPYVFASGMRNPFRAAFDGSTMLIADVGQGAVEEVSMLTTSQGGANLGWPFREGTLDYRGGGPSTLINPVLQYRHGTGPFQGNSITGGRVYRGPVAPLNGQYLFADYVRGHIWTVPFSRLVAGQTLDGTGFERRNQDLAPDIGTIANIVDFGTDSAGNVYIVDIVDGEIFQIVSGPAV